MNKTTLLIKRLRAGGLSQSEIARRIGVNQPLISRWEAGDVPRAANAALDIAELASSRSPNGSKLPKEPKK